jgi:gluconolactonase
MSRSSVVRPLSTAARNSAFRMHDPEFSEVIGKAPRLERLVETDAHEGPVYVPEEDALYFTSVPRRRKVAIRRFALSSRLVTTVRAPANGANGMTLDRDGRLVVCEQGSRSEPARISRVDRSSGAAETVVDGWRGQRLNSPNDVVVKGDGSIWFTDPSYGFLQGFRPEPQTGDHVYRYDPSSAELSVVAESFDKPNGIAFSPDERTLYVTDSGANQEEGSYYSGRPHHIVAFDVVDGRRLANERLFAVVAPGFPDGIKCDGDGRVYASSFSGVQVFNARGEPIGEIVLPGAVNFTWGGPRRNVLFITTDTAIWAAVVSATGPAS